MVGSLYNSSLTFTVPASANVKVQYTAPAGTKQIHDSKTIASKMAKSTKAALSTPEMKKVVDQVGLMMVQPSVIVGQPETQSKGSTFFKSDVKAFRPWTYVDLI